jgi:hypothetical protein
MISRINLRFAATKSESWMSVNVTPMTIIRESSKADNNFMKIFSFYYHLSDQKHYVGQKDVGR